MQAGHLIIAGAIAALPGCAEHPGGSLFDPEKQVTVIDPVTKKRKYVTEAELPFLPEVAQYKRSYTLFFQGDFDVILVRHGYEDASKPRKTNAELEIEGLEWCREEGTDTQRAVVRNHIDGARARLHTYIYCEDEA
ncbi:hypothetical protein GI582_02615 [Sulfitobacter sp. BDSS02]|nr:hypothetical protein [Sulfitobacter sp. BDSS02]MBR9847762.1 hypothetical protein [Paracoccaceae bacterium]